MLFPVKQNKKVKERSGIISAVPACVGKRFQSSFCPKIKARTLHSSFLHLPQLSRRDCAETLASQASDVPEIAVTNSSCAVSFFPIAIHVTSGY